MITQAIVDLLITLVNGTFGWLPSSISGWTPGILNADACSIVYTSGCSGALTPFFAHFGWANDYMPLSDMVLGLTAIGVVAIGAVTFQLVLWVLRVVHIAGG